MRTFFRTVPALALAVGSCLSVGAQTAHKPAAKTVPWKSYCHAEGGFCFKYPAAWTMLGEIFGGAGVVVAPPQQQARELWDEVTVAQVIPPPQGSEQPMTIGAAIAQAVSGVSKTGQPFETQERKQLTVGGNPAELVKLQYKEQDNGREWIEELAFIEGPDSAIYSVALKTAPATLSSMEPLFRRIMASWKLPEAGPPPPATGKASPAGKAKPAAPPKS